MVLKVGAIVVGVRLPALELVDSPGSAVIKKKRLKFLFQQNLLKAIYVFLLMPSMMSNASVIPLVRKITDIHPS